MKKPPFPPDPVSPGLLSFPAEMFTGTKDSITEDPVDDTQDAVNRPVLSVLAVLVVAVAVAVATGWLCRRRCPYRSYAGIREARAADSAHLLCWGEGWPFPGCFQALRGAALTGSML